MANVFRLAIASTLALACGTAGAITFTEAYRAALRNDPTYRMNYYENEHGKEHKHVARAALLPSVAGSYSSSRVRADVEGLDPLGRPTITHPRYISRSAVLQLRQPLLNLEAIARYKQARAQSHMAASQFEADGSELVLRVVGAYLDALLANDALALAKAQRDMYAEQSKANARLFEKGEGTRTDMLETSAKLDQSEAQVLEAQDALTTNRNALAAVIGMDPGTLQPLDPDFKFAQLSPTGYEEWKALALVNNADLRAFTLAVEVARLDIQRNRAGHAPRVDLVASYSKNDAETVNTFTQDTTNRSVGVQLNIPLYSGGQISALTRQSVATHERAKAELEQQRDRILLELRKAHSSVVSSVARIEALDKAVASAQLLTKATEQSIKGGVRINLDLLNAQQQLTGVQRDLAQARYNYLIATLRLRAAAGTLTSTDVNQIASYFR